jgi:hypothetical protein
VWPKSYQRVCCLGLRGVSSCGDSGIFGADLTQSVLSKFPQTSVREWGGELVKKQGESSDLLVL